jgi:hypothetical protein
LKKGIHYQIFERNYGLILPVRNKLGILDGP